MSEIRWFRQLIAFSIEVRPLAIYCWPPPSRTATPSTPRNRRLKEGSTMTQRFHALTFLIALGLATLAQAQTFNTLYKFRGAPDGGMPQGGLALDNSGNLYGVTLYGGTSFYGTAFKVSPNGKEKVLYNFNAGYGMDPDAAPTFGPDGALYGTTEFGGFHRYGAVFRVDKQGRETVLYDFRGGVDGSRPNGVVLDRQRNIYGVTVEGGKGNKGCNGFGCGLIYRIDVAGNRKVLYRFTGGKDGGAPTGIIIDSSGNLYGTTILGGNVGCNGGIGCGAVFKLDKTGRETVLHSFTDTGGDGNYPDAGLSLLGNDLYGTTEDGGNLDCNGGNGCGIVFKVTKDGKETVLHEFTGGADGGMPNGGVFVDKKGNIYGTTWDGGNGNCSYGCGVVFMLDPSGNETVLHNFADVSEGEAPGSLIMDAAGNLYGITQGGGNTTCKVRYFDGCGTVFEVTP
jgi:uncharacterized repeat protein (TIGR03803 family)